MSRAARLLLTAVLALMGFAIAGCGGSSPQGSSATPAPTVSVPPTTDTPTYTPPSDTSVPTPTYTYETPTPTPAPSETVVLNAKFGTAYNVTLDTYEGTMSAKITVAPPTVDYSLSDGLWTPKNYPQFVSFKVTIVGTGTTKYHYNGNDFYVRLADGTHVDSDVYKEPALVVGDLRSGEPVTGWDAFDSPRHGTLVYQPIVSSGGSILEWKF